MENELGKAICETCMYWREQKRDAPVEVGRINGAKVLNAPALPRQGECMFARPAPLVVPQRGALGQTELAVLWNYAVTLATSTCADHPINAAAREYHHEQCRESARRAMPEYAPDRHGDGNAGFSTPPTLAQARGLAVMVRQCDALHVHDGVELQCLHNHGHAGPHTVLTHDGLSVQW